MFYCQKSLTLLIWPISYGLYAQYDISYGQYEPNLCYFLTLLLLNSIINSIIYHGSWIGGTISWGRLVSWTFFLWLISNHDWDDFTDHLEKGWKITSLNVVEIPINMRKCWWRSKTRIVREFPRLHLTVNNNRKSYNGNPILICD